ncbi:MAG: AAA family ATPase, partial [Leptospiraceae bacterium]|nr:AAA family ATPase [Leptospiraceae bacterium]
MITLREYELKEIISESAERIIQRGVRQKDGKKVVIKSIRDTSDIKSVSRILHEYELLTSITSEGILKPIALENREGMTAILFEDTDGVSLKHHSSKNNLSLVEILGIGIQLSQTLGEMHTQNVIHKDIKPDNIIINSTQNQIHLIDFGISSRINLKTQHMGNPEVLEGTLQYISPEQTGRMNRVIDYRSDLYSLGVTLYELLTKKVPFESNDAMELVHSHIAVNPKEPNVVDSKIPVVLSNIIMKLLSKNAEDRYQSAFGLKSDLERCLNDLATKNKIDPFILGEKDFAGKFQISQKLYGRSKEVNSLLETFERTTKGSTEIILVSGFSGVGKSALVNEVHKPITEKRGNFISGKYDQFQKNIPYYAIKQAFEEFSSLLLTFSKKDLESWKEKILQSIGTNGQVLVDVIPNLELVIGKQEPVATLGPQESQNRFNLVFQNFIKAIATKNHPLVMFIDDLQWADSASLNLLKVIMTDSENHNLLLIGAYRDNEVDASHPFIMTMEEIKKTGLEIEDIVLKNLTKEDVNELVSEALATDTTDVLPLTELVYSKTSGNAFFTNEFLKSLYEENLLRYDFSSNKWLWDIDKIHEQGITDNVVELMTQKLGKLPLATQEVLKYASCIGNKFELKILS